MGILPQNISFQKNIAYLGGNFHPKKMLLVMQCDTWNNKNWNLIIF
jgi:hypothetical protein